MQLRHPVRAAVAATAAFAPVSLAATVPAAADVDPPASSTANAPAAAERATAGSCDANDYRVQKTAPVTEPSGVSHGYVRLWYSPTTRCVFGDVQIDPSLMHIVQSRDARVIRLDAAHNTHDESMTCWIDQSSGYCATGKIYDGDIPGSSLNYQSAMSASVTLTAADQCGSCIITAQGKTQYW